MARARLVAPILNFPVLPAKVHIKSSRLVNDKSFHVVCELIEGNWDTHPLIIPHTFTAHFPERFLTKWVYAFLIHELIAAGPYLLTNVHTFVSHENDVTVAIYDPERIRFTRQEKLELYYPPKPYTPTDWQNLVAARPSVE
jgi:hypothetical protein